VPDLAGDLDTVGYTEISVETRPPEDRVAIVSLARPDRLNALSAKMRDELVDAFGALDRSPEIGAIVLTGSGERAFAAGQDLTETRSFDEDAVDTWIDQWALLFTTVLNLSTPTIAANGVCRARSAICSAARAGSDRRRVSARSPIAADIAARRSDATVTGMPSSRAAARKSGAR